jgi:4-hydroxy-2-oxoheptanedioate aldolase
MKIASEQTLLIPQCETMGCLENIETITAMDGVDGIMIGPYDLSFAMGIDGQFDRPEFKEAIQRVLDACKKNGKICIIFTGNPADIDLRTEQGFDSILFNLDVLVVINYYKQIAEDYAKFK